MPGLVRAANRPMLLTWMTSLPNTGRTTLIAIVDSGPLVAAADLKDPHHSSCLAVLRRTRFDLVIPALCVAEATYLVARKLGPEGESRFLAGLQPFDVRAPEPDDWPRIAALVRQYRDFPLGGTDASVIALAERMRAETIITLDRRNFGAIRPGHCERFTLLPG